MLGVRWTIGDVSRNGFEALRLSLHGAVRAFGPQAAYVVYVNTISVQEAQARTGPWPPQVEWRAAPPQPPDVLCERLSPEMAEGVAWKLSPLVAFADRCELSLDNDVILWEAPPSVRAWIDAGAREPLLAQDVVPANGAFADLCGPEPRNSGLRGLPAGFDLAAALARVLALRPVKLDSELDEQGLQVAALSLGAAPRVVPTGEVTICSPFHPHQAHLGSSGAHFVGLNARRLPWRYYDRPATEVRAAHWEGLRSELYARVGLEQPA